MTIQRAQQQSDVYQLVNNQGAAVAKVTERIADSLDAVRVTPIMRIAVAQRNLVHGN